MARDKACFKLARSRPIICHGPQIDGSFVKNAVNDPISNTLVQAMHNIGNVLNVTTIAEYVENKSLRDALYAMGISYGQGYYVSKPFDVELLSQKETLS